MAPDEFPLPYEYRFIQIENLVTEPPADLEERTIVFLDCGNIDRNPADSLKREGAHILNIDHHHDNTQLRDGQPRGAGGVVHGRGRSGT